MRLPTVSVAIANHDGERYLAGAMASALGQELQDLEVIVVDDDSEDGSLAIASAIASRDPRVRLERLSRRGGPGAARNRAIDVARGRWLAVLDNDDLMRPARLGDLVAEAAAVGADVIADDLLVFDEQPPWRVGRFLRGRRATSAGWLTPETYLRETRLFAGGVNLGFLKPVIDLAKLRASGVRYDETLSIGEDQDLMARLLLAGLRTRVTPSIGYFYRKHSASSSHRLSLSAIEAMAAADRRLRAALPEASPALAEAMDRRAASIETAEAFTRSVGALKAGDPAAALAAMARRPAAALLLRMPLAAAARRALRRMRRAPAAAAPPGAPEAWFVSRQRLVGRANGSSAYLIDLARTVRDAGFSPRLVQPSPISLGRWPILWLKPEMGVFDSIAWRGVARLGPLLLAREPRRYLAAARAAVARLLERAGLPCAWIGARRAGYAPGAPWSQDDLLFIARAIGRRADLILADYVWQTEAFAFARAPRARTMVIMHDLLHRRAEATGHAAGPGWAAGLDRRTELRLLARADAVIAIQQAEAKAVASLMPQARVLTAPIAFEPAAAPQPGRADRILFVGSNTAPNLDGLCWLLDAVWPALRAARPELELRVAGGVCRAAPPPPRGVRYLGFVGRLERPYATAGVVVSPLRVGSGLKVKLIEALARGKACVVTPVTLQGIEAEACGAVLCAEAAGPFGAAVLRLLASTSERAELGARALALARARFCQPQAHAELSAWLRETPTPAKGPGAGPPAAERRASMAAATACGG